MLFWLVSGCDLPGAVWGDRGTDDVAASEVMIVSEITLREGIALLLGLAAAVLLIVSQVISLRHAFLALNRETPLAADARAPLRYVLLAMLAAGLAFGGLVVWIPELIRLTGYGLGFILLAGITTYVNWRIRRHYSVKRRERMANNQ